MSDFNSTLYKMIGSRIKEARFKLGYSQEILAEKLDISRASISNIEIGRQQPPLHVLYAISGVLKFDVQLLLPTFTEINQQIPSNEYSDILNDIEHLDDESKKKIQELINKIKQ
ncbi:MAG: helix-turn-helix domain-containing protein [Aquaticitalea sp.]